MRVSAAPLLIFACLAVTACASSESDAVPGVARRETTGSVSQPVVPVPAVGVGKSGRIGQGRAQNVASTMGAPPAPLGQTAMPQPPMSQSHVEQLAWAGEGRGSKAFAQQTTLGMPMPAERPVAGLMPERPMDRSLARPAMEPPVAEPAPGRGTRMRIYARQFRDAKPINFGRVTPKHYPVHGVDVSRWQGEIDWQKLRTQGANFAYIKATDGGDHLDPMFKTNWNRAKAAGIKRGAYHFFYWCRVAGEQADWFIRNVPRDPDALPPVIDVEWNHDSDCRQKLSPAKVVEKMKVFMDKLERHYGQRPVIYTAPDFYADNLDGEFRDHPFWLRAVAEHPSKVYPGRKWLFWQYSGSGLSGGVTGKIDLNVFAGSEEQWHNWVTPKAMMARN